MNDIKIKRVYEEPTADDGMRVLVDRLWPRGLTKEAAALDEWMREVAPSPQLRKEFNHQPERFAEFRRQYEAELKDDHVHQEQVQRLLTYVTEHPVTLLYAAKDRACNHALVLKEWLLKQA